MSLPAHLPNRFDAIFFDMDGTLIDSTPCVERIWRNWAGEHGIDAENLIANMHGVRGVDVIRRFAPNADLQTEFNKLLERELTDMEGTIAIPGIAARLTELDGVRTAIVTSAPRPLAKSKLEYCGITPPAFMVCAEDVADGKPSPAPYLAGAKHFGVDPARSLAFEDAPNGVRSAKAAGMTVIALTTSHPADELREADFLIGDWHDLHFSAEADGGVTVTVAE
ncbi:HAD family hydrolase [Jeongeupia chitinilytica]|uniref:Glycerol-3-phosphatase n=1 Tax=Jeongeupia chitinilytica TaxID=1041641 RepID=A0ABQ3GYL2_9NEIS|nr:HAD-IA family hydrolase [Jeongeupia chitinilytica]GHD58793.1 glycerol-3-phosphatase [Jeongeupia chitinilytica]